MRRLLALALLVLLPLQFTWAAVATYCDHASQTGAGHFGHHDHDHGHEHPAQASADAAAVEGLAADPASTEGTRSAAQDDPSTGTLGLDCGHHCHGACVVMLTLPLRLPGPLSTAPPCATLEEAGALRALARPERPQWLLLA